jgi:hypothetical protein
MIYALDPGNMRSAMVILREDGSVVTTSLLENNLMHAAIAGPRDPSLTDVLVIEQIESFGMPVGREVFETVFWSGRFAEAWPGPWARVTRRDVKLHLCGLARAKDGNIRQALIDRYGPGKDAAIGVKAKPGPLYGLRADMWSALAVGVTYLDTLHAKARTA